MLIEIKDRVTCKIADLKDSVYRDQGMVLVSETAQGKKRHHCNCDNPCGYRYFPYAPTLKSLTWGEVEDFLRRVWPEEVIQKFAENLRELRVLQRRLRESGQLARGNDAMLILARVPGPVLRAMQHDFPDEFSPNTGLPQGAILKHIEKVLTPFTINREHRPAGAVA